MLFHFTEFIYFGESDHLISIAAKQNVKNTPKEPVITLPLNSYKQGTFNEKSYNFNVSGG
jgi:hypothetical protein